jgi:hypothetical protein
MMFIVAEGTAVISLLATSCLQARSAAGFVGQLPKKELKIIPYSTRSIKWTGWDLNPRPQQMQLLRLLLNNYLQRGSKSERRILLLFKFHRSLS